MPSDMKQTQSKTLMMAAVVAAVTALGTESVKSWLPSTASYLWSWVTSSNILYVSVLAEDKRTPINKASVQARKPGQAAILAESTTDGDGRASLQIDEREIFLKVSYATGGQVFTCRSDITVAAFPHRATITSDACVKETLQTIGPASTGGAQSQATDPAWLTIALNEVGQKEATPPQTNPRIAAYHSSTKLVGAGQDVPWGCSFVSWVLQQAKVAGSPASARCADYATFGEQIQQPRRGALAVLQRRAAPEAISALVGFVLASDNDTVTLVVGNVDDQVTTATFSKDRVISYRWPTSPTK